MEEQNNIVENKNNNNNKIVWIILLVIVMTGCLIGGYFLNDSEIFHKLKSNSDEEKIKEETKKDENKNDQAETKKDENKNENVVNNIENDEIKNDFSISKLNKIIFKKNKTSLSVATYDKESLILDLSTLSKVNIEKVTGKKLKTTAKKYFNLDDIEFVDITCDRQKSETHDNVMLIYNAENDKYEHNPNHMGHGGSSDGIYYYLSKPQETETGEYYVFSSSVFFVYTDCTGDICGPTGIRDVYLSYEDAINKVNKLYNAYDKDYCPESNCDDDKIYEDIKDKTKTVKFYYKKNNDNYVFDHYEIK